jgi:hypothetical protein
LTFCNVEAPVGSLKPVLPFFCTEISGYNMFANFDFPVISFYPVLLVINISSVEVLLGRGIHGGYWISDGLNVKCLQIRKLNLSSFYLVNVETLCVS